MKVVYKKKSAWSIQTHVNSRKNIFIRS